MFWAGDNFYAGWRARTCAANFLRDENFPTERLLQAVWQHQRLRRDALKTIDGRPVRIFHPGFASLEGGPDFRNAVMQIGDEPPRSGDVEVDLQAAGWRAHGHDRNVHFKKVMLHVVWDHASPGPSGSRADRLKPELQLPVLALKNFLDAPLAELSLSLERESLRTLPESMRGKCCAPLREMEPAKLDGLLAAAARVRFENKASLIRQRAKQMGWDQALWEHLFRALGYKHNTWPMRHLGETKPLWSRGAATAFEYQARLFGVAGLLPDQLTRAQKSADQYLRRLWDCWWRDREEFAEFILPRSTWRFHGLRPANHPVRRLALISHWLADRHFIAKIEKWSTTDLGAGASPSRRRQSAPTNALKSLHQILQVKHDEFWSWHWTFRSPRLRRSQPLLGEARITDLALNAVLPWLWV
ncbi:MAG TPA: DUF2851 family protein, partial [Desulfuromonadaceae bacterium]|nr:DUF2851 family protein [Desulfuromonadaceae bacterium]